eukprot:15374383-Alexandrium_andersonii.AAC.1
MAIRKTQAHIAAWTSARKRPARGSSSSDTGSEGRNLLATPTCSKYEGQMNGASAVVLIRG